MIIACVDKAARSMVIQQDASTPQLQPVWNLNAPNPYSRNYIPALLQSLYLEEGQVYTGASLIIPAALSYDVLPLVQGPTFGPNDFEITGQMLNALNEDFWVGLG